MGTIKMVAYHGTDQSVVNDIEQNGFRCKLNREHWLGDGIYLYPDIDLAKWWTTKPSKSNGIKIKNPAIIKCEIEVEEEKVLNICTISGYKRYIQLFDSFILMWAHASKEGEQVNFKQLRCLFFNCIFLIYNIYVIIAPFNLPDQPYMPPYKSKLYGEQMHIMYPEIQMCISEEMQNKVIRKAYLLKEKS